jgi:hypothetical protein
VGGLGVHTSVSVIPGGYGHGSTGSQSKAPGVNRALVELYGIPLAVTASHDKNICPPWVCLEVPLRVRDMPPFMPHPRIATAQVSVFHGLSLVCVGYANLCIACPEPVMGPWAAR